MELKNIFIDCGGTLIKLKYPVGVIYSKIANDFDVNCDPKILESRFSKLWANREINIKTSEEIEKKFWFNISRKTFEGFVKFDFSKLFNTLYSELGKSKYWVVDLELESVIKKIKNIFNLYIISNWDLRLLKILKGLRLRSFFKKIFISSVVGYSKPSIKIFEIAIKKTKSKPEESIYVGNEVDIDSVCEKIGITFIHVDYFKKLWSS